MDTATVDRHRSVRNRQTHVWTPEKIRALGATTDLLTAASVLRIGRTKAYQLAKTNDFPVPVMHIGRRYLVAVAHLLKKLGIEPKNPAD